MTPVRCLQNKYIMARLPQSVGTCYAANAGADNDEFERQWCFGIHGGKEGCLGRDKDQEETHDYYKGRKRRSPEHGFTYRNFRQESIRNLQLEWIIRRSQGRRGQARCVAAGHLFRALWIQLGHALAQKEMEHKAHPRISLRHVRRGRVSPLFPTCFAQKTTKSIRKDRFATPFSAHNR